MVISMSNQATGGPTGWSRYATAYPKIQRTKAHPGIGDRACRRLRSGPRLAPGGSPHADADAPKALTSPTSGSLRADAASVRPSPNSLSLVLASHPAAPLTARHHPPSAPHAGRLVFLPAAAVPLAQPAPMPFVQSSAPAVSASSYSRMLPMPPGLPWCLSPRHYREHLAEHPAVVACSTRASCLPSCVVVLYYFFHIPFLHFFLSPVFDSSLRSKHILRVYRILKCMLKF